MENKGSYLILTLATASIAGAFLWISGEAERKRADFLEYLSTRAAEMTRGIEAEYGLEPRQAPKPTLITLEEHADKPCGNNAAGRYNCDTGELKISERLRFDLRLGNKERVEGVLRHELGHFVTDSRAEELTGISWPFYSSQESKAYREVWSCAAANTDTESGEGEAKGESEREPKKERYRKELTQVMVKRMLSEGLATYIQNEGVAEVPFPERMLERDVTELDKAERKFLMYEGGFQFVKPIVDRFGQDGIDYLITNPPEVESLAELAVYREVAMMVLEARRASI